MLSDRGAAQHMYTSHIYSLATTCIVLVYMLEQQQHSLHAYVYVHKHGLCAHALELKRASARARVAFVRFVCCMLRHEGT